MLLFIVSCVFMLRLFDSFLWSVQFRFELTYTFLSQSFSIVCIGPKVFIQRVNFECSICAFIEVSTQWDLP